MFAPKIPSFPTNLSMMEEEFSRAPFANKGGSGPGDTMHLLDVDEAATVYELDRSGNMKAQWIHSREGRVVRVYNGKDKPGMFIRPFRQWRQFLSDAFLPVGFPHAVTSDYLAYQTYDSLQAFFSTITSLLANRALLEGLGVGDGSSSATFAMLLTILKDATSRVSTIAFAHRFGLAIEPEAKYYRFLADLLNDSAFFLELASPYLSSPGKVAALSTGEALRAMCGVAGGASKAALSAHFARHDNLAELNAKEASQETAVGLLGLLVGSLVVRYVQDPRAVLWLTVMLVMAHLVMNYRGVRCVTMTTFNRQRATIVFLEYLRSRRVLTPRETARREHVLNWSPVVRNASGTAEFRIRMAASYGEAFRGDPWQGICIPGPHHTVTFGGHPRDDAITVLLHECAKPVHAVAAWFRAVEVAWLREPPAGAALGGATAAKLAGRPRWSRRELWEELRGQGWDLDSAQGFETAAPVRIRAEPYVRTKGE